MNSQGRYQSKDMTIRAIRNWLNIILYVSIVGEMIFFPSWENFVGCMMVFCVLQIFSRFFLKKSIIIRHTFSFLTYLTLFLACFIPLPATLIEGKPITYGFEVPIETFFWETVLFITASLGFYISVKTKSKQNNLIQRILIRHGFFEADSKAIWIMGLIGFFIKIRQLAIGGSAEFGDVSGKFLSGLTYLQYAPLILLFPKISNTKKGDEVYIWTYTVILFLISIATNSREAIVHPIFIIILLLGIDVLNGNKSILRSVSPPKLILGTFTLLFLVNLLSDISLAMLATRGVRKDVSKLELFSRTITTLQDENTLARLRKASFENRGKINSYGMGWDETYLNNFMLNRYGNMRITDQTLYYTNKIGFANEKMRNGFDVKVMASFPQPLLQMFGVNIDKNDLLYSPGDMLFMIGGGGTSLGSFRVTSLISDGLATLGYACIPVLCILFFLTFRLLDSFVIQKESMAIYATLALILVFNFVGMLRHSDGLITLVGYLIRGFWQQCFTYWFVISLINLIVKRKSSSSILYSKTRTTL